MKIVIVREAPKERATGQGSPRRPGGRVGKIVAAITAVTVLGGVGLASAAIPNSTTGQLTVCARTTGLSAGQMRLIDYQAGQRCGTGERTLSWQQNGMRYRGAWKSTVAYAPNDVVVSGGNAYVALAATTNVAPTTASKWSVMASFVHPSQIVWVAKSGGDFTSLSAALASIKDASAAKPYVVRIAPGVFVEKAPVQLKSHVDVVGSGESATTVTCACASTTSPKYAASGATLVDAGSASVTISDLSVVDSGPAVPSASSTYSTGVWVGTANHQIGTLTLRNVSVDASGGTGNYGLVTSFGIATVRDSSLIAVGAVGSTEAFGAYGYHNFGLVLFGSDVSGGAATNSVGIYLDTAGTSVHGGSVHGATDGIYSSNGSSVVANEADLSGANWIVVGASTNAIIDFCHVSGTGVRYLPSTVTGLYNVDQSGMAAPIP